jgi:hypothetical protein
MTVREALARYRRSQAELEAAKSNFSQAAEQLEEAVCLAIGRTEGPSAEEEDVRVIVGDTVITLAAVLGRSTISVESGIRVVQ